MKCEICDEAFDLETRSPLVLQCGHTFCKWCLTQSVNRSGYVQCFVDRIRDDRGLAELPKNFALVDSAKLDQQIAARIRGIHLGRDLWLDERELELTNRSLGSGATGQVVEGVYKERPVSLRKSGMMPATDIKSIVLSVVSLVSLFEWYNTIRAWQWCHRGVASTSTPVD